MAGSFLLGSIADTGWSDDWFLFLGTGLLGSFTTFSTLHWETLQMSVKHRYLYLGLTYSLGLLAAFLGFKWNGALNLSLFETVAKNPPLV